MARPHLYVASLVLFAALGCDKGKDKSEPSAPTPVPSELSKQAPAPAPAPASWYRVSLHSSSPSAEIPFFLKIPSPSNKDGKAEIRVGEESLKVPLHWETPSSFKLDFELFQASLKAEIVDATLKGEWVQDSGSWGLAKLTVKGSIVTEIDAWHLFPGVKAPPAGAAKHLNWRLEFPDSGVAQLSTSVDAGSVHGTLSFESGNRIALAGRFDADTLKLAGFDGTSAYLFTANQNNSNELRDGQWMAGPSLAWQEGFAGQLAPDFVLEAGPALGKAKRAVQIKNVDLKNYKGKATIIELAGSWCITCRYAAPFLREIYQEFHPQGLEMLTLAYEFTDDKAYNNTRAKEFKKEYELAWEVMAIHGGPESFHEIMPQGIEGLDASGFPISIFMNSKGQATYIHAGFPASKNSEDYKEVTREYRNQVRQLLNQK